MTTSSSSVSLTGGGPAHGLPARGRRARAASLFAVALAVGTTLAPAVARGASVDLYISEYVEGLSNTKALELFNGTSTDIDLAAGLYTLEVYANGSAAPTSTVALSGTIAAGTVFVVANPSSDAAVTAVAAQQSTALNFNGNDVILIRKAGAVIDSIGQLGNDPGIEWGSGNTSTADNTLRRKPSVMAGDPEASDPFDPAVEWIGFPLGTFDGLGLPPTLDTTVGGLTLAVTVEAVAAPCLVLDANVVDFGTLAFSTETQVSVASRGITVTSCSTGEEDVLASGTDATGNGQPAATWALSAAGGNPCTAGLDSYGVRLTGDAGGGLAVLQLSTATSGWLSLADGQSAPTTVDYQMPCQGSSGAGQTMTSQITFTAVVP